MQSSKHLARLWAFDEVRRLIAARRRDEAVQLAAKHQLVTPVSGAVVLETKQQFDRAGLQPVDPKTVPLVPEPSGLLLLVLALGAALGLAARRRAGAIRSGRDRLHETAPR